MQIRSFVHGLTAYRYLWLYVGVLISFLVYVSDIFTAVTMLTTTSWSNAIFNSCPADQSNGCVYIPFSVGRWLFFGCVVFSFLLVCFTLALVPFDGILHLVACVRGIQGQEDHSEPRHFVRIHQCHGQQILLTS